MNLSLAAATIKRLNYWLSEQQSVVEFQWSPIMWGSTWSFLIISISTYIITSATLHLLLLLFIGRRRPIPLGPIPVLHSLAMSLISATIFLGILSSAAAEIRDTRWIWQRSKTPFQWLLCFPIGTRPSGRVFFWSYVFYLSRFLHIFRTFFTILRRRSLSFFQLFNHSILICMSFLWLEFSQSFQVIAILLMTLVFTLVYGYRFWIEIGFRRARFPFVMNCHLIFLGCNLACHIGVLLLHFYKGGCNGMGAWFFNSVLNSFVLLIFLRSYVKTYNLIRENYFHVAASSISQVGDFLTSQTSNKLAVPRGEPKI
ncbi:PREDICTED: elongation of fatty acids protein 3-like [Nicotiana attenuata]|uniref:Elongation of fatty acids protein 3-like protein n=1 Tax=Nicotiana attenuata TaxID=49451 RepID=A0A314KQE3_NICAT|nr:PREDICTED: elongation of fatty acids protein 3-like [Nicotiana attenuata]OIT31548.1 elongation of fatty acids protein 3-like protein [Nicotiana attenuata]